MAAANNYFTVRGRSFFHKPFFNIILATNISMYKYLADLFFDGDMSRIVWSSNELMFRKRQEQLAARKLDNSPKDTLGILDIPFCSFRIIQDGINPGTERNWWNPGLHVEGIWFEELGRRLRLTPATIDYEACFCCSHDTDLFMLQQDMIWDRNKETILESFIDATAPDGTVHTLKNIIIYDADPQINPQFAEKDWLEKNKIQTITLTASCQTWLIAEDDNHRYSVTKKFIFDFLDGANYLNNLKQDNDDDIFEAEQAIYDLFVKDNVGKIPDPDQPSESVALPGHQQLVLDL